jgi:hypothetical protein
MDNNLVSITASNGRSLVGRKVDGADYAGFAAPATAENTRVSTERMRVEPRFAEPIEVLQMVL